MKKVLISLGFAALALGATAQVKIKDGSVTSSTTPNANSILDLESNNKGLHVPRVSLTATNNPAPLNETAFSTLDSGLVVYNLATAGTAPNNVTPGLYYCDGTQWVRVAQGSPDWRVFGSSTGINGGPAANTDSQYVMGRVAIGQNSAAAVASSSSGSSVAQQAAMLTVAGGDASINRLTVGMGGGQEATNTAFGRNALFANTSGASLNLAIGYLALRANTSGSANVAIGSQALSNASSGSGNVSIGASSGNNNTSGNNNVFLGNNAGTSQLSGNNNIIIASGALAAYDPNGSNQLNIGGTIWGTGLSTSSGPSGGGNGRIGINIATPSYTLHVNGSVAGTSAYNNLSDARYKQDVQPLAGSLDKVLQLRGITFNWNISYAKAHGLNVDSLNHIGFLAQEVEKIFPQVVTTGKDENHTKAVSYSDLVPVLAEAIKEQQKEIEALKKEIQELKK